MQAGLAAGRQTDVSYLLSNFSELEEPFVYESRHDDEQRPASRELPMPVLDPKPPAGQVKKPSPSRRKSVSDSEGPLPLAAHAPTRPRLPLPPQTRSRGGDGAAAAMRRISPRRVHVLAHPVVYNANTAMMEGLSVSGNAGRRRIIPPISMKK